MASSASAIIALSCRLAPLRQEPSGVPSASATRWRFVPDLPRSVGFGPVAGPLFGPGQTRCPGKPGSSRSHPPRAGAPGARDAGGATRPPLANPAADASNSCRSRSPSRPAASPRAAPSVARTGYPSAQPGSRSDDAHPLLAPSFTNIVGLRLWQSHTERSSLGSWRTLGLWPESKSPGPQERPELQFSRAVLSSG
jgi:hypothetical protein